MFHCPQQNHTKIQIEMVRNDRELHMYCNTTDDLDYDYLPTINANHILMRTLHSVVDLSINAITFHNCPLPSRGFQSIFQRLGVDGVDLNLEFTRSGSPENNIFRREHFAGVEDRIGFLRLYSPSEAVLAVGVFDGFRSLRGLLVYINTSSLPPSLFQQLTSLVQLDLGFNIVAIDPRLLINQRNLRALTLDGNNGSHLIKDFFQSLKSLTGLHILNYKIGSLNDDVFEELTDLEYVKFTRNDFQMLPADLFRNQRKLYNVWISDHGQLRSLPDEIFTHMEYPSNILISECPLEVLSPRLFRADVYKTITVRHTEIEELPSFNRIHRLEELNLSHNKLGNSESSMTINLHNARVIDLSYNNYNEFPFIHNHQNVESLKVNLSYNQIEYVPSERMYTSKELHLDLTHNRIKSMDFNNYYNLVMEAHMIGLAVRVTHLYLDANPLHCDCHLEPLVKQIDDNHLNALYVVVNGMECASPAALTHRKIQSLNTKELVCPLESNLSPDCLDGCECFSRPHDAVLVIKCPQLDVAALTSFPDVKLLNLTSIELYIKNV